MWQVVEKEDFATEWHIARYNERAMQRYETEEDAVKAAKQYVHSLNCDNALTQDEQRNNLEAFMMTEDGCFLGTQHGKEWFMNDRKGKPVTERSYHELEGKIEVKVRVLPGT